MFFSVADHDTVRDSDAHDDPDADLLCYVYSFAVDLSNGNIDQDFIAN